jgi:hypothetical protein
MADPSESLQLPDPDTHLPYKVLSQQLREELTPDNRFIEVWEISYEGPSGVVGTVKIPASEHDPASIDRAISAQLHTVESVAALGAVPHPENLTE